MSLRRGEDGYDEDGNELDDGVPVPPLTLTEKAVECAKSPWGGSTNFESAHDIILDALTEHFRTTGVRCHRMSLTPSFVACYPRRS